MNCQHVPLYQSLLQKLPRWSGRLTRGLGYVLAHRIKGVVNRACMKLDLRESIQASMFLGTYEPTQTHWFKMCVSAGDTVIDVGASFGYYTTLASTLVGPKGHVFAVEPSPVANQVIEDAVNDTGIANVALIKAAVGKEAGYINLYLPTTKYLHSPSVLHSDPDFIAHKVPVVVLDQYEPLQAIPRIKLVKIDVEGYEPNVLDSMEGLIRSRRIENVFCEFNSGWLKRNSTTPKQLLQRFLDYGFRIRAQTELQENLVGRHGELFDLQDIWFSID